MYSDQQSVVIEATLRELMKRNKEETNKHQAKTVYVMLFYHMNGMDEGLRSLKQLNDNGFTIRICADPAVFKHYHVHDLANKLGFNNWLSVKELEVQKDQINHFYIPVLPFSTVSDLLHFNDNRPLIRILLWALMKGKAVSALTAGADPFHPIWQMADLDHGTPILKHEMKKKLQQIRGFGIRFIEKDDEVISHFLTALKRKRVITAEEIERQWHAGECSLEFEKGTIITPLAHDLAKKYAIKIVFK